MQLLIFYCVMLKTMSKGSYWPIVLMLYIFLFEQDNLSFPLICPDWNADEEMLLLEVLIISLTPYHTFFTCK